MYRRRRIGLGLAILMFAAILAIKPQTGRIDITLNLPASIAPGEAIAAVEVAVGTVRFALNWTKQIR
jgi:hypothetical protein